MQFLIKSTILALANIYFQSCVKDRFVDLVSLNTNHKIQNFPKASKTGTYSFKLSGSISDYKLYGCFNQQWKKQILLSTELLLNNNVSFPRIYAAKGKYILAQWIEGQDIRHQLTSNWNVLHERIVHFQTRIYEIDYSRENITPISYLHTFLLPRFKKYASKHISRDNLTSLYQYIDNEINQIDKVAKISHPDLTHYNLIDTTNGLIAIDNETLHFSYFWLYDVLNTANIVFKPLGLKEKYLESCSKHTDISDLYNHKQFWDIIWLVRMTGSYFQAGQRAAGLNCLNSLIQYINQFDHY